LPGGPHIFAYLSNFYTVGFYRALKKVKEICHRADKKIEPL